MINISDVFKAYVCNSSSAACRLALKNPDRFYDFAQKIISVKQDNALMEYIRNDLKEKEEENLQKKMVKFDWLAERLSKIK